MVTIRGTYEGQLHCNLVHGPSGRELTTDAPKDNMGKGESFSPTDLLATSLGACMMTIMGIFAERHEIDLSGTQFTVIKEMVQGAERRIKKLTLTFQMAAGIDPKFRGALEKAAHECPVKRSLHSEVEKEITFEYLD